MSHFEGDPGHILEIEVRFGGRSATLCITDELATKLTDGQRVVVVADELSNALRKVGWFTGKETT